jgi:hypothetical protein
MATGIRIGHDDFMAAATLTTDSAVNSLPVQNLQDPVVAKKWRTGAVTSAYILADLGSTKSIGAVALLGHNLSASGTWRVRISTADATGAAGDAKDIAASTAGVYPDTRAASKRFGQPDGSAYAFFTPVSGRYLRLDLSDATLTYIQAGLVMAMNPWEPARGYSFGASWERADGRQVGISRGGQAYINRGPRQRRLRFSLNAMTQAQAWTYADELDRVAGQTDNVLVCLDVNSAYLDRMTIVGPLEQSPMTWAALPTFRRDYAITQRL